ncbi:hypothetical protein B0I72DRAFT_135208 [Yarrowia lipolytica]|jgi:hypothetical protein|uniref:YALI0E16973p n=3 Tax=Yarrowia lipolytica TaxID=4952 RepID=Q6C5L6_YARLI|nr:YALI0E16973p [Yarrowia lipolytica CLIB122]AOW05528.1 hypothetical protein YALI1_E20229g [Yarrowia lipolytica]KAB8282715.1 hypothetical protein BKA91DRAFT_137929 [Yarrowia lipolytica]KAE8173797.1 hypothetical protein BKA90DRAFT_135108 [Yarrowia lipolytica]KAJ8057022.1 hypothetical protein LXG23DRAFT_33900 [Yarrowia lipolytica]QNP99024.1 Metallothionein expression activator [Yarrowia lipolytica]|eukprot:XP_504046.1 YALI0E16973p [Yarrowia lipolytica CLIB122]
MNFDYDFLQSQQSLHMKKEHHSQQHQNQQSSAQPHHPHQGSQYDVNYLDIGYNELEPPSTPQMMPTQTNNVSPDTLARFSRLLNFSSTTPSPTKPLNDPSQSDIFLQQPPTMSLMGAMSPPHSSHPPAAEFGHAHSSHLQQNPFLNPPQLNYDADALAYLSPEPGFTSPEMDNWNNYESPHDHSSPEGPLGEPFDEYGLGISWLPVVTIPENTETEQIIEQQKVSNQPQPRKSGLPPGKLESFIHGPCEDGKFLCLYPGCGKKFGRRYNLCSHIQTHLADRPYSCSSCEASFVRQHDLKRHERTHAVVKPHICPCGKGFNRPDALNRHRARQICSGGIEVPGQPKPSPGKKGRPRKVEQPIQMEHYDYAHTSPDFSSPEYHSSPDFEGH